MSFITFEEYVEICSEVPIIVGYNGTKNQFIIGVMDIKEKEILVVKRANKRTLLITALPEHNKKQYPKYLEYIKNKNTLETEDKNKTKST